MKLREAFQQLSYWIFAFLCSFSEPKHRASLLAGSLLFLAGFLLRALALSQVSVRTTVDQESRAQSLRSPIGIYRVVSHPDFLGWALFLGAMAIASERFLIAETTVLLVSLTLLLTTLSGVPQIEELKKFVWTAAQGQPDAVPGWLPRLIPLKMRMTPALLRHSFSRALWKDKGGELRRVLPIIIAFTTLWIYLWTPGVYWIRPLGQVANFAVGFALVFEQLRGRKRSALN